MLLVVDCAPDELMTLYGIDNSASPFSIILGISLCFLGSYSVALLKIIRKFVMFKTYISAQNAGADL